MVATPIKTFMRLAAFQASLKLTAKLQSWQPAAAPATATLITLDPILEDLQYYNAIGLVCCEPVPAADRWALKQERRKPAKARCANPSTFKTETRRDAPKFQRLIAATL